MADLARVKKLTLFRTLAGMFPDLDKDVIDDVVRQKQGRWVSLQR